MIDLNAIDVSKLSLRDIESALTLLREELDSLHGYSFIAQRERLVFSLRTFPRWRESDEWARMRRRAFGLMMPVDGLRRNGVPESTRTTAPFGWKWDIEIGRDVYLLMPWWVYYVRRLRNVKWWMYRTLVRLGFWKLKEGPYYVDGSWTWAWWQTLEERCARQFYTFDGWASGRARITPASKWERFGWWIQKVIHEMEAPYA